MRYIVFTAALLAANPVLSIESNSVPRELPRQGSAASEPGTAVQVGRYLRKADKPNEDQIYPLRASATLRFPKYVNRVGDAFEYAIETSGYTVDYSDKSVYVLFNHRLPEVQREIGPLSISNIIEVLAGSAFEIQIDDLWRSVRIKAKNQIPANRLASSEQEWKAYRSGALGGAARDQYAVKQGDSLSLIGRSLGLEGDGLNAWMVQVLKGNSHAFLDGDVNKLLAGAVLNLASAGGR